MRGSSARGADGFVGALQSVTHRDGSARSVTHHHRHQERRHTALAFFEAQFDLLFERAQATDAGAVDDAEATWVDIDLAGVLERFGGRCHRELLDRIGAARFFGTRVIRRRIPVLNEDCFGVGDGRAKQALPKRVFT